MGVTPVHYLFLAYKCTLKWFSANLVLLNFRASRPITRLRNEGKAPFRTAIRPAQGQGEDLIMTQKTLLAQGYSLAEEVANSISHGIGFIFGIVGLVLMLTQAIESQAGTLAITSYSLYGGSMILLFLASTLYHAVPHQRVKYWLKRLDHCAIYLLIAGTYTPFLLVGLQSPLAHGLMGVIWSLALLGVLFKLAFAHRFEALSVITYLLMGWLSLIVVYQLALKLSPGGIWLLASGGIIYSLGVIFYLSNRIPYNHAIWHGFVLGGSLCHFLSIYFYVM